MTGIQVVQIGLVVVGLAMIAVATFGVFVATRIKGPGVVVSYAFAALAACFGGASIVTAALLN